MTEKLIEGLKVSDLSRIDFRGYTNEISARRILSVLTALANGEDGPFKFKTLAELQALGSIPNANGETAAVGDLAVRTDTNGRRLLECLTIAEASSSWGFKEEFWLLIGGSSSSTSNLERFTTGPMSFTVGSNLGQIGAQFFYPELFGYDSLEIIANTGRFLRNSDPGSTDINLYKNGNAMAIDSDTVDPGADTEAAFDVSGEVDSGEWFEIGIDPTNVRVTWEKTYAFVKARGTYTVTS